MEWEPPRRKGWRGDPTSDSELAIGGRADSDVSLMTSLPLVISSVMGLAGMGMKKA